ncbi:MAG: uroporphyrinogen-III C-methyltransferase [Magnetococcales bacterium]|nr:uroporphyrinogen-III C-methyltransferase [Magnetococcales bacterium]
MSPIKSIVRPEPATDLPLDLTSPYPQPGMVLLVGAGPGDPDLLTIAALKALRNADVVVHDALVSPEILDLIPESCERIHAGKRGGSPSSSQKDISETLVRLAKAGRRVVRLKGGDPFVFGRGGEEAERLVAEGIPFRVVPGLTSGIAGPAYAGIPITHRDVNANVAFLTGHESAENPSFVEGSPSSRIHWESVARAFPVLVLYMAIQNLPVVVGRLIAAGRSPETPVAVVRWATTRAQQTLVSTLGRLEADVTALDLQPPAVVVIGDVVRYRESLQWFPDETLLVPDSAR